MVIETQRTQRTQKEDYLFSLRSLRFVLLLLIPHSSWAANQLLMTLQVDSAKVQWQEEFVLRLEIYGEPSPAPPQVTIDGLDQFQLRGQGQNLLQVPGGKTVKWILTYTLIAGQDGTFKLGPAMATVGNHTFRSNTLFITVENIRASKPKTELVPTPLVHSAAEVGERVVLLLETENIRPYRGEGIAITLRLLSQLPVENLRFLQEAEFPGFLKYDFPYSDRPRAALEQYKGQGYAAFDLQKFLVFPLRGGDTLVPPFRCEILITVPSGSFAAANLRLTLERASNFLTVHVRPLPVPADLVGDFRMRRELAQDGPRSKAVRLVLEGDGVLSTFNFPEVSIAGADSRLLSSSTTAELAGGTLHSSKTMEWQIDPDDNTTNVVLPAFQAVAFSPERESASVLSVPPLPLRFEPPPPAKPDQVPPPDASAPWGWLLWVMAALSAAVLMLRIFKPRKAQKVHGFASLFRKKKPHLTIPKSAAQNLYEQIAALAFIKDHDSETESLTEMLKIHLPEEDWAGMEDILLRLELTAFAQMRGQPLTYGELKDTLLKMEKRWLA